MRISGMKALRSVGVMYVASFVISADRVRWFLVARLCRPGARSSGLNVERMPCFYSNDLARYYCYSSQRRVCTGMWNEAWLAQHNTGHIGNPRNGGSNPGKSKRFF